MWTDAGTLEDVARKLCNTHHEYECWDDLDESPGFSGPQQSSKAYWRRIAEPLANEIDRLSNLVSAHSRHAMALSDANQVLAARANAEIELNRLRSLIRAHKDACGLVDGGGWDVDARLWEAAGIGEQ